jgi:hypothetical protein
VLVVEQRKSGVFKF